MAYYAALVSLVQLLKDITQRDRYSNSFLDKHQLHVSLYAKFNLLLEMLDDYSPKVHDEESNDILEKRIRDAAYWAQDMIESRVSTILLTHIHLENGTSKVEKLHRFWASTFRNVSDNIGETKYYQELEKLKTEVDSILEELIRIKAESGTVHEDLQQNSCSSEVEASRVRAPSGKNTMLVFDEGLRTTIKAQLCGESSKLEVISISGMGGLGKTTLAMNIFDDGLAHDRFDCRAWVTVSQDYHLKNVLLAIVNSLNINEELDGDGEAGLQQYLYKNLFGRRYLIVVDDVWEVKVWNDIRRIFPDNSNGSRIMITTRLSDVANYASSSKFRHQMQFLDEDQSWILLRGKMFAAQEHCPKELEVIGKLIAKNCGGLPLAIVVIAGVLSNVKRAQYDWENIARKVSSSAVDHNDEHLSTILSLSYNHLPHHLKPCFLYLGGYPEDHEIRISKLIKLWAAEGFLKPNESKSLEEVGEEYFKDIVNRNLVLITKKESNGKFKFCIIHDVLRELCSQKACDENFLLCVQRKDDFQRVPIENVRRICLQTVDEYSKILKYIKKHGSHVRSLINCFPKYCYGDDSLSAASGCKLLRILDTRARLGYPSSDIVSRLQSRSGQIGELFHYKLRELLHLRYLKLVSFNPVPSRIVHLQYLQTLILDSHVCLPSEIWKMPQLRHVMSKEGVALPPIPYNEVKIIDGVPVPLLGSLQTLSRVEDFRFTGDNIKMILNLKKLGFKCHSRVHQIWEGYVLSNLVRLHQLETLYLLFDYSTREAIPLPKNFAFSSTLIKLTLVGCKLPWKDMSAVGSLPNLQVLRLRSDAFLGEEWETIEGEFLKLKFLEMDGLYDLKYWRAENIHFPRLENLHIRDCFALQEIPPGIGDIPTLQLIMLELGYYSNPALRSSALEIQEQQRDLGNDDIQVRVIPYGRRRGWSRVDD